jgi:NADPH:quinone reductase-like Zn-dependent oxidoreductase
MKAVLLTAYGDVDKLELRDLPDPKAGPNEIKVRMAGAGINPIDWKIRSGARKAAMPVEFPTIPGRDASGEVVEVGAGVTTFKVGARVMGVVRGGYAEFVIAPAGIWAEVPAKMDLVEAGALPLVLTTGGQLIEEALKPKQGDTVLVTGAAGGVGRTAVFVAKARGATVWAGILRSQKASAMQLGADHIVALDDDNEVGELPKLDGIADTVGGETIKKLFDHMKRGGTIASVVGEPEGAKERGLAVSAIVSHPDAKLLGALARAVADEKLVIPIARKLPLAEAGAAQKLAEKGAGGKVILTGKPN